MRNINTRVRFHFQKVTNLQNRNRLKIFVAEICRLEKRTLDELSFVFCTDEYLLEINKAFLQHDYFTDIISFNLAEKTNKNIQGEIYISVDRISENAREFAEPILKELHRVIFHGVLHLCGYKDKSKADKRVMRKMEDKYLTLYFG